jgi:5-azacytidine-induced protein 1
VNVAVRETRAEMEAQHNKALALARQEATQEAKKEAKKEAKNELEAQARLRDQEARLRDQEAKQEREAKQKLDAQHKEELARVRQELGELKQQLAQLQQHKKDLEARHQKELEALRLTLETQHADQLKQATLEIALDIKNREQAARDQAEDQAAKDRKQIEELKEQIEELKTLSTLMERNMEDRLRHKDEQLKALTAQLADNRVLIPTPPPTPELMDTLKSTNDVLAGQVKSTQEQIGMLHELLKTAAQEKQGMLADLRAASARINAMEMKLVETCNNLAMATQEATFFKSSFEQQLAQNRRMMQEQAERVGRKMVKA